MKQTKKEMLFGMKTFKAKLKHDGGEILIRVIAENEQDAIKKICAAELCPERAIVKIIEIVNP